MFYFKNQYAKVWNLFSKDKVVRGSISTSEKDKNGDYVYSNWVASFVGKAAEKASGLKSNTNIIITSGKISNSSVEKDGKRTTYYNVSIFDFDIDDGKKPATTKKETPTEEVETDDIPWN